MSEPEITSLPTGPHEVARTTVVDAPAAELFALVADPHLHGDVDGSGTVGGNIKGPDRLGLGAKFTTSMKQYGVPYRVTSTVTAFEEDRVIEWRTSAGHRWRWEFAEEEPGHTRVTETFDASGTPLGYVYRLIGVNGRNAQGIEHTLVALKARFAPRL